MLFDIRGRRRHVVRVVYAILALLMGGSLFLVVGPFNIAEFFGAADATSPSKVLNEQAERIEGKLRVEPDNEDLLLSLTRARVAAGNALTEVNPETGVSALSPEGRREVALAAEAWDRYLQQTDEPNPSGAQLMATAYFSLAEGSTSLEEAQTNIEGATAAQQIVVASRPSVGTLTSLAIYQYFALDFAAADKTAKKAKAKAPKAESKEVSKQLTEYR